MKKLEEVQQSVQAEENEKAKIEIQLGKLSTEEDQLNSDVRCIAHKNINYSYSFALSVGIGPRKSTKLKKGGRSTTEKIRHTTNGIARQ
jgi:hypothetical protein